MNFAFQVSANGRRGPEADTRLTRILITRAKVLRFSLDNLEQGPDTCLYDLLEVRRKHRA
jgi:hypothetical protein